MERGVRALGTVLVTATILIAICDLFFWNGIIASWFWSRIVDTATHITRIVGDIRGGAL